MDQQQITQLLQSRCFPHPARQIQLVETHISWVILTGDIAYKIKKPVNFGFLNFSTLSLRLQFCREEIRLNQALCGDLYLDVVPVLSQHGVLSVGDSTEQGEADDIIDYAVRMRQFNASGTLLDTMLAEPPDSRIFRDIGYRVAAFHQQAPVSAVDSPFASLQAIAAPVLENFRQTEPLLDQSGDIAMVAQVKAWSREQLAQLEPVLRQRIASGFIRELHGDLHLGNIACIDGQWKPFDRIEFSPGLRWIDTASDLAFLFMDLQFRGFESEANGLLNAYLEFSGDFQLLSVLGFYTVYRAMVRAKVSILRLQQSQLTPQQQDALWQELRGYLFYAQRQNASRSTFMIMVMGVSGSGKSTLATQLAGTLGAIHLRSDVTRKRLFGLAPGANSGSVTGGGIYTRLASQQTFAQLVDDARQVLDAGFPVIVDATFLKADQRKPFTDVAQTARIPLAIIQCQAEVAELERRILQRQQHGSDASEAGIEVMRSQLLQVEPVSESERPYCLSTQDNNWRQQLEALLQR